MKAEAEAGRSGSLRGRGCVVAVVGFEDTDESCLEV